MTVGYRITDHIDASLMVNNITDALPKYPGAVSMTRYYEALMGRSFKMSVGKIPLSCGREGDFLCLMSDQKRHF
ncbi:hypothetical protein ZZ6_0274 [Zymomonas mobilis subsp. mobilis ATCC 29191]|uniref:TonB-dependent receptor n=1 Tax=Zymomonas mobilis TaxID=542 RepID=UPI00026D87D2|nr:hypothetical protein ZZ6_0274 [Zymomonas mobilis subsp. mobilis ATCC 29191]